MRHAAAARENLSGDDGGQRDVVVTISSGGNVKLTRPARCLASCLLAGALLTGCGGGNAEQPGPTPTRSAELPSPSRSAESPSPTRTVEKPSPTRTVEKPSPTRTAEQPSPTRTAEQPSPTPSPVPTQTTQPSTPVRTHETTVTATPESTAPSGASQTEGAAQPTETPQPTSGEANPADQVPTWVWWLLAAVVAAALAGTAVALIRRRRRQQWLAELEAARDDVAWFARVLLPELRHSASLEQVVGGWTIGAPRVAAAEDRLTVLEASAPGDADRSRARTLRDATRLARQRLDALTTDTPHETWALDLDEVAADLEVALGPAPPPAAGVTEASRPPTT